LRVSIVYDRQMRVAITHTRIVKYIVNIKGLYIKMEKTIFQFIPIILIFLFLRYTENTVALSHTVLGKLFAVSLILFYTKIDVVYGLIVCLLVICYYQSDYVEGMKTAGDEDKEDKEEDADTETNDAKTDEAPKPEGFTEYAQMYQTPPSEFGQSVVATHDIKKRDFIQQHCDHQTLKYKNQPVRPDATEHIFTEIEFNNTPCNVCSKGCPFVVKYLQQEEALLRPNLDDK